MPRPRPPYLHYQETRHGVRVWYVRRGHGPRTRIRAEYGTEAFWTQYRAAIEGKPPPSKMAKAHTLAWAIERYRESSAWAGLSNATRRQRENIYRHVCQAKQRLSADSGVIKTAGDVLLRHITSETIKAGRERRKDTPHAANNFLKAMRGFFAWASDENEGNLVGINPTKGIKKLIGENDETGHHTWTPDEVARFEARWPVGTRERLALDLLLYTGLRRGDVVRVGKQHVRNGEIVIRTEKHHRGKSGAVVTIPILAPLAASIKAVKTGDLTFLVTQSGRAWVKESFGNWFREAARKAGCPGSAHGMRKAGATRAAENGATVLQLMAMYGWRTAKMALHYTEAADRARLAREGAQLLLPAQAANKKRPHLNPGEGENPKKLRKAGA
jgi:integrase